MLKYILQLFGLKFTETKNSPTFKRPLPENIEVGKLYMPWYDKHFIVLCTGHSPNNPRINFAGVVVWRDNASDNDSYLGQYYDNWFCDVFEEYHGEIAITHD